MGKRKSWVGKLSKRLSLQMLLKENGLSEKKKIRLKEKIAILNIEIADAEKKVREKTK